MLTIYKPRPLSPLWCARKRRALWSVCTVLRSHSIATVATGFRKTSSEHSRRPSCYQFVYTVDGWPVKDLGRPRNSNKDQLFRLIWTLHSLTEPYQQEVRKIVGTNVSIASKLAVLFPPPPFFFPFASSFLLLPPIFLTI